MNNHIITWIKLMKTNEAILKILSMRDGPTKYALSKVLSVQPIMIDHYLNGSRMKQEKAGIINEVFDIEITDVYDPTKKALERYKNEDDTKGLSGEGK
jgi:hypothetical protein